MEAVEGPHDDKMIETFGFLPQDLPDTAVR